MNEDRMEVDECPKVLTFRQFPLKLSRACSETSRRKQLFCDPNKIFFCRESFSNFMQMTLSP